MNYFYEARISVTYREKGGAGSSVLLVLPGQYMLGEPVREWSLETASHNLIGAEYGVEVPTGNARMTYEVEAVVKRSSVRELEVYLRRLEIRLNTKRAGTVEIAEAYEEGEAGLRTKWEAVVNSCTVRRLTSEEAPAEPGAWGAVVLSFTLTNPEEL